jgi:hypothetical protein
LSPFLAAQGLQRRVEAVPRAAAEIWPDRFSAGQNLAVLRTRSLRHAASSRPARGFPCSRHCEPLAQHLLYSAVASAAHEAPDHDRTHERAAGRPRAVARDCPSTARGTHRKDCAHEPPCHRSRNRRTHPHTSAARSPFAIRRAFIFLGCSRWGWSSGVARLARRRVKRFRVCPLQS